MPTTLTIGRVRCHLLSDGLNKIDGGGFFGLVPRVLWQRVIQPNELNQIPADTRSLLIEADAGLILVDTGVGDKLSAKQRSNIGLDERTDRLVTDLRRAGFEPADVDIVILTHLHADHAGGATRWLGEQETGEKTGAQNGKPGDAKEVVPMFPQARYLVQRLDLAEASFPNERTRATYHAENWQPLIQSGQLEVVNGPQRLDGHVRTDVTPGHTNALQVVWVEDGGEALLFLGDACSWAAHMNRLAWVPSYDLYPLTSIETKRRLRAEALARDAMLVFQHDGQIVTGRLAEGDGEPAVVPEITQEAWADPTLVYE